MFSDSFCNQKKQEIKAFYATNVSFAAKHEVLKVCLDRKIARELRILRFDGKKIPKEEMAKIEKEAKIDAEQKEVYEAFIKFENMILLKSWTTSLVRENFERLALLHNPSHVASLVAAPAMA